MTSAIEQYFAPTSLDEAALLLREGDVTILASGTDLMPQSQAGRVRFARVLMNISRIPELKGISVTEDRIVIGALATVTDLMESDVIRRHVPVLAEAGDHFARAQLRNAATVGCNISNASPASEALQILPPTVAALRNC